MNKIKDFIYNKSDIIIAILILAIAALIIFWRLGIILEYPKQLIGTDDASSVLTEPETGTDQTAAGDNTDANAGDNAQTGIGTEKTEVDDKAVGGEPDADKTGENQTDATAEVTKTAQWDGDKLAADLEVKLVGTTAYEAVTCLVDAGVFKDYEEYQDICGKMSYDHEKMKAGVFTFAKGSTKEDIIKEVNWSE